MRAKKRIIQEFRRLKTKPLKNIEVSIPNPRDQYNWDIVITGPPESPYDGNPYKLEMNFTQDFPSKAPDVRFVSDIYHMNVQRNGQICLALTSKNWSTACSVSDILMTIYNLFMEPNESDPANNEILLEYQNTREEYNKKAKRIFSA